MSLNGPTKQKRPENWVSFVQFQSDAIVQRGFGVGPELLLNRRNERLNIGLLSI
jgi:hypothetical protein